MRFKFFGNSEQPPAKAETQSTPKSEPYVPIYKKEQAILNGNFTKQQILNAMEKEGDVTLQLAYIAKLKKDKMLDNAAAVFLIQKFNEQTRAERPSKLLLHSIIDAVVVSDTSGEYKRASLVSMSVSAKDIKGYLSEVTRSEIRTMMELSSTIQQAIRDPEEKE
ncbi:MAG: hypothetical protein KGH49_00450 [Candidatus Micrarchaeota archaeon]|nr:hypothetical protein [Candidatus Micrarchaeota archaeon]